MAVCASRVQLMILILVVYATIERDYTHGLGHIIFILPVASLTSIGLSEAAETLIRISSGPVILGTGRSRIS